MPRPYNVYVIKEDAYKGKDGTMKSEYTKIGIAWPFKAGPAAGFNLELRALPPDGKCTVFPPKDRDDSGGGYDDPHPPVSDDDIPF